MAEASFMKRRWMIAFWVALLLVAGVATLAAGVLWLEVRSSDELLEKLALAQPGVQLSEIRGRLGREMRVCERDEDVRVWGSVRNEEFFRGKKLYWFLGAELPYRAIEVYTDANDVIVYATWRQL